MSWMLPPGGAAPLKVTLCVAPENCHVTVSPTAIVTLCGLKVVPGVVIVMPPDAEALTVTTADPLWVTPPEVRVPVIVAVPGAIPVTSPEALTDAIPVALEAKLGVPSPEIGCPSWSRAVTVRLRDAPTGSAGFTGARSSVVNTADPEPAGAVAAPPPPHAARNAADAAMPSRRARVIVAVGFMSGLAVCIRKRPPAASLIFGRGF
jgi:hypothetical protein